MLALENRPPALKIPILRTKLHRPALPANHVLRSRLLAAMEEQALRPVVLVSAPAGYGKSTLVSCWLEQSRQPGVWLSLDELDSDLQLFLNYVVTGVQNIFPDALGDTAAMINSPALPPVPVLAATLVNELDRIGQDFTLVFDDIHSIGDKAVLDLLSQILRQPPRSLRIILVGRRDPILPIAALRARAMLTELRMEDLRFTVDEARKFLGDALGDEDDQALAEALVEKSEGWITGLHLAVLAMERTDERSRMLLELKGTTRYVVDYLVGEVLEQQPDGIRRCLLSSSILRRFCAPLCDALLEASGNTGNEKIDGNAFIDWLQAHNLFIIPLDTENRWFRYHHLFADLLRAQLQRSTEPERIAALHARASAWHEEQGLVEGSIQHALAAGDMEEAADIVERNSDTEFDTNRWFVAARWLELLPEEITRQRPKLLLARARVLNDKFRLMEIPPLIQRVQQLLETGPVKPAVQAEFFYFQGFLTFWEGDGHKSRAFLEQALELLPETETGYLRAQSELFYGLATQINGRGDEAVATLRGWIQKRGLRTGLLWERLTYGLAVIHLLQGQLAPAEREGQALLEDSVRTGTQFIQSWSHYLLGVVAIHRYDLDQAQQHFGQVAGNRYAGNSRAVSDSMVVSAIIQQFRGHPDEADQWLEQAEEFARWTEDSSLLETTLSGKARIALLRDDLDTAARWQRGFSMPPHVPAMIFFPTNSSVTECRVLLALGTDSRLAEAVEKLDYLRQETSSLHNSCQAIDIIALQALAAHRQGREDKALDLLEQALALAEPGEWVRPFVEPGPPMVALLQLLLKQDRSAQQIRKILALLRKGESGRPRPQPLIEPLTTRELDVLDLLTKRLRNKEISEKLHISPVTVKSHLRTIYQKLGVSRRREAVERAAELGIVDHH